MAVESNVKEYGQVNGPNLIRVSEMTAVVHRLKPNRRNETFFTMSNQSTDIMDQEVNEIVRVTECEKFH